MLNSFKIGNYFRRGIVKWHLNSPFPYYDPWFKRTSRGAQPRTQTGGKYTITAMPGVGLGPELMEHVMDVFECIGAPAVFEWLPIETNDELEFQNTVLSIRRNGIGIKGNIEEKRPKHFAGLDIISKNAAFRRSLDLFVNVAKLKSFEPLNDLVKIKKDIDIVVMRGNHEGEYHLLEHSPLKNLIENYKVVTSYNAERVANYAFRYAIRHKRKKITIARNLETAPLCDNLFAQSVGKIAKSFTEIELNYLSECEVIQKAMKTPEQLDIVIVNGLSGSLLAPLLHGMIGGVTLACFGEISERYEVFQPAGRIRGTKLINKDVANPTGFLLAGASALHALGATKYSTLIIDGLRDTFQEGVRTVDLGGKATTKEFIKSLVEIVRSKTPSVICKYDLPLPKKNSTVRAI